MLICRKCQAPANDSRRDWGNERVLITYVHADGREHSYLVPTLEAQKIIDEDRRGSYAIHPVA